MTVWGVSMFKDEADVAYATLRHLVSEGLHGIIVADNGSTDGTHDELERAQREFKGTCDIRIEDDPEVGYYQSRKMTALAMQAGELGASWIVPFDADEVWYCHGDRFAKEFDKVGRDQWIVEFQIVNHFCTKLDPVDEDNPFMRLGYRQAQAQKLPKVAARFHKDLVIEQGNHSCYYRNMTMPDRVGGGWYELRHFPYRSLEQFIHKAVNGSVAYAATNLAHTTGQHWREYGALLDQYGPEALREVFERWFEFDVPSLNGMVLDPAPWCRF